MKIFIFLILAVAFLMFYQANPLYAVIIIMLFLGIYLLIKRRKSIRSGGGSIFFSGKSDQQNSMVDLILIQQLINSSSNHSAGIGGMTSEDNYDKRREIEIENTKQEILQLFEK